MECQFKEFGLKGSQVCCVAWEERDGQSVFFVERLKSDDELDESLFGPRLLGVCGDGR